MPNHTDVRAYFVGDPKDLQKMRRAMRQSAALTGDEPGDLEWELALKSSSFSSSSLPIKEAFGSLPPLGERAPFTLQAGVPMPRSLLIEEGSDAQFGEDMLKGNWSQYQGYKRFQEPWAKAGVRNAADALAWAKLNEPEALRLGQARLDNIKEHGAPSWYEWSVANWGTKWDAYDQSWGEPKRRGSVQEVKFNTAWSPPLPALAGMCKRFGVDCAVGYVDEGGGFANLSILRASGEHELDVEDYGSSRRSLWPRVRKEAKTLLDERAAVANEQSAGAKRSPKQSSAPEWLRAMDRGDEPDATLMKGPSAALPAGESAADAVFDRLGPQGALDSAKALRWLRALKASSVVDPADRLGSGQSLGDALINGVWAQGFEWALENVDEASGAVLIRKAAARAIIGNAPEMAAMAYAMLPETDRPTPEQIEFSVRPEAFQAIALSPAVADKPEALERFYELAKAEAERSSWDRMLCLIDPLARALERVRIDQAAEAAKAPGKRPGL